MSNDYFNRSYNKLVRQEKFLDIPPDELTEQLCIDAIKDEVGILMHVPNALRTKLVCMEAVKQSGWALQYVPTHVQSHEMWEVSVRNYGVALEHVPPQYITHELCVLAITNTAFAFNFVPVHLTTKELCVMSIEKHGMYMSVFFPPPSTDDLEELYIEIITQRSDFYQFIKYPTPNVISVHKACWAV